MARIKFNTGCLCVLVLAVVCTTACEQSASGEQKAPPGPRPALVETVSVDSDVLIVERRFLGEVRSARTASLAAGGAGEVERVLVSEGDAVRSGQLILQLDDAVVRGSLQRARAELERNAVELAQAERDAARLNGLAERGFSAAADSEQLASRRDALEAQREGLRADVARLSEQVDRHRVRAAFDGTVTRRHVDPGDWVQTGQGVVDLVSTEAKEVFARVPSSVLDALPDNPQVRLRRGDETIDAALGGVVGALDPRSRTALLRLLPDSSPDWLRDGGTVDVAMTLERRTEGVVVGTDALVYGPAGARVIRVADGKAEPVEVAVVARHGDRVLVETQRLTLGDTVVIRGNERVRPGQPLQEKR